MSIDTGNGGINIDNLVYEFDTGDLNAEGIKPIPKDRGTIAVDHSIKDISKNTKKTLANYLSEVSLGKRGAAKISNDFPISNDKQEEISITDQDGYPTTLSNPTFGFAIDKNRNGSTLDSPDLRKNDFVKFSDPAQELNSFGKGKTKQQYNGNNLLQDVTKVTAPQPVKNYVSAVINNNRFTETNKFSEDLSKTINNKKYTENQLKQVGVLLSLRSSQEFPAAFNDSVNPVNAGAVAGAMLPSPNQLGMLKINNTLLTAKDALEHLANTNDEPIVTEISPIGNQSWGSLNNVEDPWTGMLNVGMVTLALAMQSALLLAFEGLATLLNLTSSNGSKAPTRNPDGTYVKGQYYIYSQQTSDSTTFSLPNISTILGIKQTVYPFPAALKTGTAAFFIGADKAKSSVGDQLVGALKSAVTNVLSDTNSAGYLIVVSRMIIRTSQLIATDISKISKAFSSNPISGLQAIAGMLESIKNSKLIAAMNVFANLGDVILGEDDRIKSYSNSITDALDDNVPAASVKKSRLQRSSKLAWSNNRSPAMYLLPDSIAMMSLVDSKLGSFKGPLAITDPNSRAVTLIQNDANRKQLGARIPYDSNTPDGIDVKSMEAVLESEYMPFYFHDLRTNEIISCHAFIDSLTDDYTQNTESVDGYGRVDPIKIYKNTNRKISLSFYLVSTSEQDHDEMYMKLNKLVTLVYPQYTKGKTLPGDPSSLTQFVQPFSQMIGASPLVRIRFGDVIRSNYSRFALARLFGAADNDMKIDGNDIKFSQTNNVLTLMKDSLSKAFDDRTNTFTVTAVNWPTATESSGFGITLGIGGGASDPDQIPTFDVDPSDLQFFEFSIRKSLGNGSWAVYPKIISETDAVDFFGLKLSEATNHVKALNDKYSKGKYKVIGGAAGYAIPETFLRVSPKSFKKMLNKNGGSTELQNIDKISQFLDVEQNALVKSFRSTQGKGLAGFIDSLNLNLMDKGLWETKVGSRAPMIIKISISFSPIADIPMGIDHMGYNRAPAYPVGNMFGFGKDV